MGTSTSSPASGSSLGLRLAGGVDHAHPGRARVGERRRLGPAPGRREALLLAHQPVDGPLDGGRHRDVAQHLAPGDEAQLVGQGHVLRVGHGQHQLGLPHRHRQHPPLAAEAVRHHREVGGGDDAVREVDAGAVEELDQRPHQRGLGGQPEPQRGRGHVAVVGGGQRLRRGLRVSVPDWTR